MEIIPLHRDGTFETFAPESQGDLAGASKNLQKVEEQLRNKAQKYRLESLPENAMQIREPLAANNEILVQNFFEQIQMS